MKAKYLLIASALTTLPGFAQETYENEKLTESDLNGTARYVGMGGAMEALGADISTMQSNPAGIGLFRRSQVTISGGLVMQGNAPAYVKGDKTNASFDQVGFVYAMRAGERTFVNMGFNYHKSKNFNFLLGAANRLNNASANKLTYQKLRNGAFDGDDGAYSGFDHLNVKGFKMDGSEVYNYPAADYQINREHYGYIGDYDFNLSANLSDAVYLGLTASYKDVNYRHRGIYTENLVGDGRNYPVNYGDIRSVDGDGIDLKLGIIVRPIETSPFRFGAYVQTPTWYDLTMSYSNSITGSLVEGGNVESYDYKIFTPWKFGFSLGHTVGKQLALGATYEYADYSTTKTRIIDGQRIDWYYDDVITYSHNDADMNEHTSQTLKGVSLLKLGAEYKPISNLALRVGYNYESAHYDDQGVKGVYDNGNLVHSPGIYYTSSGDYTNWKATNRFTCGLGYNIDNWNIDLAYQYSTQKGDFHPFADYVDRESTAEDNIGTVSEVKNNRSQLLLTVGYRF